MLEPEILDPARSALANALPALGFAAVSSLRIGKHIALEVESRRAEDLPDDAPSPNEGASRPGC